MQPDTDRSNKAAIRLQLRELTEPHGGHQLYKYGDFITTVYGRWTPHQAALFLTTGVLWPDELIKCSCDTPWCCLPAHLSIPDRSEGRVIIPDVTPPRDTGPSDEDLLALVQQQSVSLVDLYQRGKKAGLIQARTEYPT